MNRRSLITLAGGTLASMATGSARTVTGVTLKELKSSAHLGPMTIIYREGGVRRARSFICNPSRHTDWPYDLKLRPGHYTSVFKYAPPGRGYKTLPEGYRALMATDTTEIAVDKTLSSWASRLAMFVTNRTLSQDTTSTLLKAFSSEPEKIELEEKADMGRLPDVEQSTHA